MTETTKQLEATYVACQAYAKRLTKDEQFAHDIAADAYLRIVAGLSALPSTVVRWTWKEALRVRRVRSGKSLPANVATNVRLYTDERLDLQELGGQTLEVCELLAAGYTQTEVAEHIGTTQGNISKIILATKEYFAGV